MSSTPCSFKEPILANASGSVILFKKRRQLHQLSAIYLAQPTLRHIAPLQLPQGEGTCGLIGAERVQRARGPYRDRRGFMKRRPRDRIRLSPLGHEFDKLAASTATHSAWRVHSS